MPLRSVEAASRDDAIAAAREQFGPSVRVVGVRRVRSGGVLGFFATERYVAEVAADPFARPELTAPGSDAPSALETTGRFASPLSGAATATAAPAAGTGRTAAPARNGAAAYARTAESAPRTAESAPRTTTATRPAAREDDAVSELAGLFADAPAEPPVGLYGPGSRGAAPRASQSSRDAVLPRVNLGESRPPAGRIGLAAALDPASFTPDAPSPFTAALARMAAGDRDVRDAVDVALDQPRVVRGRTTTGSWPSRSTQLRSQDSSTPSGTTRQEEEPVGEQVVAPPSIDAPHGQELPNWAAEPVPAMGSPREEAIAEVLRSALAQGHSDEALAGILRKMLAGASPQTALADPVAGSLFQDVPAAAPTAPATSDAGPTTMSLAMALAGAGSAVQPAVAVPEPVLEVAAPEITAEPSMFEPASEPAPAAPEMVAPEIAPAEVEVDHEMADHEDAEYALPAYEEAPVEAQDAETPADEPPSFELPAYEPPAYRVPSYRSPAYESPLFDSPLFARPTDNTSMWGPSVASIWGEPTSSQVPLWGGTAPFRSGSYSADLPIWDDVMSGVAAQGVETAEPVDDVEAVDPVEVLDASPAESTDESVAEAAADSTALSEAPADELAATAEFAAVEVAAVTEEAESALPEPEAEVLAPVLARTASDPAPLSLDATSVMPPISLLPPLPGSRAGRGRPPVPPAAPRSSNRRLASSASRTAVSGTDRPTAGSERPMSTEAAARPETTSETLSAETVVAADDAVETTVEERSPRPALATVTHLHVATRDAVSELPEIDLFEELGSTVATEVAEPVSQPVSQPEAPAAATDTVSALESLGVPAAVLGDDFARDVAAVGTYAALTRALSLRLPAVPELPTGAGEVLFVVGPGVETLRAGRTLAASLRLDPESVQWATRGDLAGLAPRESRMTTAEAARQRREATLDAGTVTIVAVDVPMRTDASWMEQLLAIWSPVAVWAVVEATRKAEDLDPWLARLSSVDALVVADTDLSGEPAAALRRTGTPVAVVDGVRATAHRWASLLCERLETRRA